MRLLPKDEFPAQCSGCKSNLCVSIDDLAEIDSPRGGSFYFCKCVNCRKELWFYPSEIPEWMKKEMDLGH